MQAGFMGGSGRSDWLKRSWGGKCNLEKEDQEEEEAAAADEGVQTA